MVGDNVLCRWQFPTRIGGKTRKAFEGRIGTVAADRGHAKAYPRTLADFSIQILWTSDLAI